MRAWIGLGSNIGNGPRNIEGALRRVAALPGLRLIRRSGLYRSEPWGRTGQPDFTNAVAAFETALDAMGLLAALREIEAAMGRGPAVGHWAPRIIDLDILLLDDRIFLLPGLTVPHPRMHRRRFVLLPLSELEPDLVIPGRGRVACFLRRVAGENVTRIG